MKKGFIAAPLLGAIIFLAAVLFTTNLSKIETADTSKVVNEAYHNRVVSLLEIYRTDLASIFRETVSRSIQKQLLTPGWLAFSIPKDENDAKSKTYEEIRKDRCETILTESVYPACPLVTSAGNVTKIKYGIPQWVQAATQKVTFESIEFTPSNPSQAAELNPNFSSVSTEAEKIALAHKYLRKCNKLISKNVFDCEQFKNEGRYQCIDGGKIIPGCEEGTFLVKVKVLDPEVFPFLPRITGDDGFGNVVRSGAIADKDFYLPINIRVFKYDDYALKFYNKAAYGVRRAGSHEGSGEGVVEGLCNGGNLACLAQTTPPYADKGFGSGYPTTERDKAMRELRKAFYDGAYSKAAGELPVSLRVTDKIEFGIMPTASSADCYSSATRDPQCKDLKSLSSDVDLYLSEPETSQTLGTSPKVFAFYTNEKLSIHLIDSHPAYRVEGGKPNDVKYTFNLKHS